MTKQELIAKANQVMIEARRLRREQRSLRAEAASPASELDETVFKVRAEERRAAALRASTPVVLQGEVGGEDSSEVSAPYFGH